MTGAFRAMQRLYADRARAAGFDDVEQWQLHVQREHDLRYRHDVQLCVITKQAARMGRVFTMHFGGGR